MTFEIGRWRGREWAVFGAAVLLLGVSLSDWYGERWRYPAAAGLPWTGRVEANAWESSTAWTLAICLAVVATGLWLAHQGLAVRPRWVRRTAAVLLLVALGACGWQRLAMGPLDDAHVVTSSSLATISYTDSAGTSSQSVPPYASSLSYDVGGTAAGELFDRDDLRAGARADYEAGPRWGLTAGVTLLVAMLLLVLAPGAPWTAAGPPGPPTGPTPPGGPVPAEAEPPSDGVPPSPAVLGEAEPPSDGVPPSDGRPDAAGSPPGPEPPPGGGPSGG